MARGAGSLEPTDIAISEATADAVYAAGKQVYVGRMLDRGQSTVASWCTSEASEIIPLRLVPALENMAAGQDGWPHITRALAKMQGFELFRLPAPDGEATDWLAQIGILSTEAADITRKICTGMGDRKICAHDVQRMNMIEDAEQLVSVAVAILARLRAVGE